MMVNIKDLEKAEVLLALYNHAQGELTLLSAIHGKPPEVFELGNLATAQQLVRDNESFDMRFAYVDLDKGSRAINVSLSKDEFNPRSFDSNHGLGQAQRAIDALREAKLKFRPGVHFSLGSHATNTSITGVTEQNIVTTTVQNKLA
jgi:hypothetical protein